ncbi:MAG: hypothetical protein V5A43_00280 [Haloarculaceae archaeon]
MDRRELEEIAIAIGILAVLGLGYVGAGSTDQIAGVVPTLGKTLSGSSGVVLVGLGFVLSAVVTVGILAVVLRYWAGSGVWFLGSLKRGVDRLTPDSILWKAALWLMIVIGVLLAFIGAFPLLIGDIGDTEGGAVGFADSINDQKLNEAWDAIISGDSVDGVAVCSSDAGEPPGGDADGDGIPDDWERTGQTPWGAPLPDADPAHRDVYVQLNYGDTVTPLSSEEKTQIRQTWAEMPVDNPDGTGGITIHLDEEGSGAGALGGQAVVRSADEVDRFYNASIMDDRQCVYHQAVVGQTDVGETAGFGARPGFVVLVDGTSRPDYEGEVTFRTAMLTHQLLHNVVGQVDGDAHTAEGWLAGGSINEYLSNATAVAIEERGLTPVREPTSSSS